MAGFLSLPAELIQNISCMTEHDDRKQLRLVCQLSGRILESQVLHTIYLNFHNEGPTLKHNISMIRWLATAAPISTPFSRSTRCLVLGSLSPRLNHLLWIYRMKMLLDESYKPPALRIAEGDTLISAENKMRKHLFKALASLSNLQSIRWTTAKNDEAWCQKIVVDALDSLSSLSSLSVDLEYLRIDLPISFLQKFSQISMSARASASSDSISLDNLAKAIASFPPQVTDLEIVLQYSYLSRTNLAPPASLHHYLRPCNARHSSLRLRHLKVKNLALKLDDVTTPHLMYLTSLDMSNVQEPSGDSFGPEIASSISAIWSELARLNINLERISVSAIPPSFLSYLKHYSGLKSLSVRVPTFQNREQSDKVAMQFFRDGVLAKHVESLENLRIDAAFEDYWCFGEHNRPCISRCRQLRYLWMAVSTEDLRVPAAEQQSGSVWDDVLGVLLSTIASHLPDLAHLSVASASPEHFRFASVCGNGVSNHFSNARDKLMEHLAAYRAPAALFKLPIVSIVDRGDSKTFEPELQLQRNLHTSTEMGSPSFWRYRVPLVDDEDIEDWMRETRIGA